MKMMFWRVAIEMVAAKEKSQGGIILPDEAVAADQTQTCVGQIIDMGELAFTARSQNLGYDYNTLKDKPKVGDFVIITKYGGRELKLGDRRVKIIEDYEILATTQDPSEVSSYVN